MIVHAGKNGKDRIVQPANRPLVISRVANLGRRRRPRCLKASRLVVFRANGGAVSSRHPIVLPFSVSLFALIATLLMATGSTHAQTRPEAMQAILNQRVQSPDATAFQVQRYLMRRIPKSPAPSTAEEWSR